MTETMTMTAPDVPFLSIEDMPWQDIPLPPTEDELPYDDGEPMESPWHCHNGTLLKAAYLAAREGQMKDYYVGVNMFVYYSLEQTHTLEYKGPDVFIVKNVDGTRSRLSWVAWAENGRYPDVIFELLSPSTERNDLTKKKHLYEQVFHTAEYFCIAPDVKRLVGWRLERRRYVPIQPNEHGWLWSEELGLWIGAWHGMFLGHKETWARFYHPDGRLVLLAEEAERQRAEEERQRADEERQRAEEEHQRAEDADRRAEDADRRADEERQRADDLATRLAQLEAELNRMRSTG